MSTANWTQAQIEAAYPGSTGANATTYNQHVDLMASRGAAIPNQPGYTYADLQNSPRYQSGNYAGSGGFSHGGGFGDWLNSTGDAPRPPAQPQSYAQPQPSYQAQLPSYQRGAPQFNQVNQDDWVTGYNRDGASYSVRKGSGHEGSVLAQNPMGNAHGYQSGRQGSPYGQNALMGMQRGYSPQVNYGQRAPMPQFQPQQAGNAGFPSGPFSLPPGTGIAGGIPANQQPAQQNSPYGSGDYYTKLAQSGKSPFSLGAHVGNRAYRKQYG